MRAGSWRATLLLAAAALLLFALLPQRTLHGIDGEVFVTWIEQGRHDYPRHIAYLHLAGAVYAAGAAWGLSAFGALLLTSAAASALGLMFLHRAFLVLTGGGRAAAAVTVAVGVSAPWFFYATCAEIHGVFVAGAGLAWWALACHTLSPSVPRALLVGAATGAAAAVHAFGHVLLPTLAGAAWVFGAARRPGAWRHLPAAGLAHAGVAAGCASALGAGAGGQAQAAAGFLAEYLRVFAPQTAPDVLLREWVWPFAPWSLTAVLALWHRPARPFALATLLGIALHLPLTVLLLGHHHIHEGGAYHLALLPPAVLCAWRMLRTREFALATLAAGVLAVSVTAPEWRDPVAPDFVAAVEGLQQERPMALIVGRRHELDGVRTTVHGAIVVDLGQALHLWLEERMRGGSMTSWFDGWSRRFDRAGRPLLLADSAHEFFRDTAEPEVRAFWDDHVPRHYLVVPELRRGFRGVWLLPLPGGDVAWP